jgi:hypothetical protein
VDYHQDPYFDQFGGYNAFRAMVYSIFPDMYDKALGGYAFIPEKELRDVLDDSISAIDRLGETFEDAVHEYMYDVFEDADRMGIPLPDYALEFIRVSREQTQESKMQDSLVHPDAFKDFLECPMMQEVEDILHGRWSRKRHWAVANC